MRDTEYRLSSNRIGTGRESRPKPTSSWEWVDRVVLDDLDPAFEMASYSCSPRHLGRKMFSVLPSLQSWLRHCSYKYNNFKRLEKAPLLIIEEIYTYLLGIYYIAYCYIAY